MPNRGDTIGRALLVAIVVLSVGTATLAAAAAPAGSLAQADEQTPEPDVISMTVYLPGDDRGVWTIEHRYRLENETDRAAFDELAADIEANESAYVDRFRTRMNGTVDAAATATDREMALDNVSIETEVRAIPREYGIIRYRFDWHGFALEDGNRLVAGDAVGGLFLEDGTSLQIRWAEGYDLDSARPNPDQRDDRSVQWHGPAEFGADEPRTELAPADGGATGLPGATTLLMGLGLVALVVLVGGGVWYARNGVADEITEPDEPEPAAEPTSPDEPPEELLSNEEQVIQLITERGGRMKQQEVVETLGWTDAKTSQVVSTLREDGELESFRLGRENVLRLPDVDDEELP